MNEIVSRETQSRLEEFQNLVQKWNPRINLISNADLSVLWSRHIQDSLQIFSHIEHRAGVWADFGSGGGFPGIVLACALADTDIKFVLVESDQRKSAFLRNVIRELKLSNVVVKSARIEQLDPIGADLISARALAPLSTLLGFTARHMRPHGEAWFLKGASWRAEIDDARQDWAFNFESFQSKTSSEAALLKVSEVNHV